VVEEKDGKSPPKKKNWYETHSSNLNKDKSSNSPLRKEFSITYHNEG